MSTRQPCDDQDDRTPRGERRYLDVDSPVGPLRIVVDAAAIVGLYHGDHSPSPAPDLLGQPASSPSSSLLSSPSARSSEPTADAAGEVIDSPQTPECGLLGRAAVELEEYFAGDRQRFDVPVVLRGTDFQRAVWAALIDIPFGERRSYRDIAEQLGNAGMGRAIGAAVRANPVSIIVPGHRIVSSTGTVIGYAAGVETKIRLLDREAEALSRMAGG